MSGEVGATSLRRRFFLGLALLYGRRSPFPQRKWRICLFLLRLGGIHPWLHSEAWRETVAARPDEVVPLRRGFAIACNWQDTSYLAFTMLRDHQPYESDLLEKLIQPGDTIIDGGANIGFYTLLFAVQAGAEGRVFAYEPVSAVAADVRRNLAVNRGVRMAPVSVRQCGLGDEPRTLPIYLRPSVSGSGIDSQHSSFVADFNTPVSDSITEEIEIVRLDDEEISGRIDLAKCDIEGYEKAFLEGAKQVLRRDQPLLVLEWNPGPQTYGVDEILESLESLGYDEVFMMRRGRLVRGDRAVLESFVGDVVCAVHARHAERLSAAL